MQKMQAEIKMRLERSESNMTKEKVGGAEINTEELMKSNVIDERYYAFADINSYFMTDSYNYCKDFETQEDAIKFINGLKDLYNNERVDFYLIDKKAKYISGSQTNELLKDGNCYMLIFNQDTYFGMCDYPRRANGTEEGCFHTFCILNINRNDIINIISQRRYIDTKSRENITSKFAKIYNMEDVALI